jgi:hypothetical protein
MSTLLAKTNIGPGGGPGPDDSSIPTLPGDLTAVPGAGVWAVTEPATN